MVDTSSVVKSREQKSVNNNGKTFRPATSPTLPSHDKLYLWVLFLFFLPKPTFSFLVFLFSLCLSFSSDYLTTWTLPCITNSLILLSSIFSLSYGPLTHFPHALFWLFVAKESFFLFISITLTLSWFFFFLF